MIRLPIQTPSIFALTSAVSVDEVAEALGRLLLSAVFGAIVALLYRSSRDPESRNPGFSQTLVLLAALITMVTMAVGQNVAAAFTLVGTLAIVRFRTVVRDTRDMAFVIFSVAVGMALGAPNLAVAGSGVLVIGGVIVALRAIERRNPGPETAELRIVLMPPDPDPGIYAVTLNRFAKSHAVRRSAVDRESGLLDLRIVLTGVAPQRSPELLAALLEIPEIVRASYSPEPVE